MGAEDAVAQERNPLPDGEDGALLRVKPQPQGNQELPDPLPRHCQLRLVVGKDDLELLDHFRGFRLAPLLHLQHFPGALEPLQFFLGRVAGADRAGGNEGGHQDRRDRKALHVRLLRRGPGCGFLGGRRILTCRTAAGPTPLLPRRPPLWQSALCQSALRGDARHGPIMAGGRNDPIGARPRSTRSRC